MVQQIFVDSRDRISGTSTDFSIQLQSTLVLEGGGHKMRIDQLRVPMTVPTIQTGVNDTLIVLLGATHYTITIPQANYDGPALALELQGLLFAAPGAWTVTYDVNNIAMTITCTNNFTITGGSFGNQLLSRSYTYNGTNSYHFAYVPVLGLDMCYISSSRFATVTTFGPSGSHDTLMCAIVDVPYGGVLKADMPYDVWVDCPAMTAQQLDFQLRDRSYNVLTIVPNISFVVTID